MFRKKSVSSKPLMVTDIDTEHPKNSGIIAVCKIVDNESELNKKNMTMLSFFYALETGLRGLNLSYSVIKYFFDMMYSTSNVSSSKLMKAWVMTPAGAAGTVSLIVFSMLASQAEIDDKNVLKRYLAAVWPHARSIFKDLKKGNKFVGSTIDILTLMGADGQNLQRLLVPFGLLLGGVSILQRYWRDDVLAKRKAMSKTSIQLLADINNGAQGFDRSDVQSRISQIQAQYELLQRSSLLPGFYDSFIDSINLYFRFVGILSSSPIALVVMALICVVYFAARLATHQYDDYRFQRDHLINLNNIELALNRREMIQMQNMLLSSTISSDKPAIRQQMDKLARTITELEGKHEALDTLLLSGTAFAFVPRIKHILDTFDTHSSMLITASGLLPSFAFSILTRIYLMAATCHILVYLVESAKNFVSTGKMLAASAGTEKTDQVKRSDSISQMYETVPTLAQSFMSGFKKGVKTGSFLLNPFSHDHLGSVMTSLLFASALLNASVSTLSSYIKATKKKASSKQDRMDNASEGKLAAAAAPSQTGRTVMPRERSNYQLGFFSHKPPVLNSNVTDKKYLELA